jgi:hypothetical protein
MKRFQLDRLENEMKILFDKESRHELNYKFLVRFLILDLHKICTYTVFRYVKFYVYTSIGQSDLKITLYVSIFEVLCSNLSLGFG